MSVDCVEWMGFCDDLPAGSAHAVEACECPGGLVWRVAESCGLSMVTAVA